MLIMFWKFPGYSRCTGSYQCILTDRLCDSIKDCQNGWDESDNVCFRSEIRQHFKSSGDGCSTYLSHAYKTLSILNLPSIIVLLDQPFDVTVHVTDSIELFYGDGQSVSFESSSCPCEHSLEPTCLLTIKATSSSPFKGFILYVYISCF